jgi:peptidase E
MGGGGFSMEQSPLLDDYILDICGKECPKICFVPTASGDSEGYVLRFYRRFGRANCSPTDLKLFEREITDLEAFACSQDIIYVGGGNTANMLAVWHVHGFDSALRKALSSGTVLAGLSAGSLCWFESGLTDSFGKEMKEINCLRFLPGSYCPHYDSEKQRQFSYKSLVERGMVGGYAVDDGVGLHFINGHLHKVVSSRTHAKAYRVESLEGRAVETPITPILLDNFITIK